MNLVENTVERVFIPAGAVASVRIGSPGSTGSVALASGDVSFAAASVSGAGTVRVGPFESPCEISVSANGLLVVDVGSVVFDGTGLVTGDGAFAVASSGTPGTTLTDTGTGYAAPCEFWGIEVSAYSGGPQTVVVRNGGAGGTIVATFTVSGMGFYSYSGPWNAPGNGQNLSRAMSTDVHLTISGGTSRSITPIVSPV